MSANTRIAASATALVLAATGLAACNDSEGDTDTTAVNPSDAITSEDPVSGGSSAGGSSVGGSGDTGLGGAEASDFPLGGTEAPEQVDPLSPQMTP